MKKRIKMNFEETLKYYFIQGNIKIKADELV